MDGCDEIKYQDIAEQEKEARSLAFNASTLIKKERNSLKKNGEQDLVGLTEQRSSDVGATRDITS